MTKHDYTVLERSTIWPADRPLIPRDEEKALFEVSLDEYLSVVESAARDALVREYLRLMRDRGMTKKEVFSRFRDAPPAYVEDMVARLKAALEREQVVARLKAEFIQQDQALEGAQ